MTTQSEQFLPLRYDDRVPAQQYNFLWSRPDEPYLRQLRNEFELETVVAGSVNLWEQALKLCHWVHTLWVHNGRQEASSTDPISIIRAARADQVFRCVEYALVAAGCLGALGMAARCLSLKRQDVEVRTSEAGHVAIEVYLHDYEKWVFLDPQFDIMPVLHGTPLNAVELQAALAQDEPGLGVISLAGIDAQAYLWWIQPYLFYLDVKLDNRIGVPNPSSMGLMLVPLGAPEPKVMQRRWLIENMCYTHSQTAFYAAPTYHLEYPAANVDQSEYVDEQVHAK